MLLQSFSHKEKKNKKDKQAAMSHDMLTNKVIPIPGESTKYLLHVPVCQSLVTSLIV